MRLGRLLVGFSLFVAGAGAATAPPPSSFSVSTGSVAFGNVYLGASATMTFTVTNTTPSDFPTNFSVVSDNPAFSAGISPSSINDQQQGTVSVTFTPTSAASFSGTLTITASQTGFQTTSQNVAVSGTGLLAFTFSPSSLSLGNVLLGCSSSQRFTIFPATPLTFNLSLTSGAFTVNPSTFNAPGATNVKATFAPTAAGTAAGFINLNAVTQQGQSVQPQLLPIVGTGVDITALPAALDFGQVPVGSTSSPRTVTISANPSVQTVYQFSATSSSGAFTVSPVSPSGSVQISFAPAAAGAARGTISITATDPQNPSCPLTRTVAVTGTGIALNLSLSPASLNFGNVSTGTTSAPQSVALTNGSTLAFTGTVSSSNGLFAVSPASFSVNAGGTQSFSATFAPTSVGPQSGTVTFTLTSAGSASPVITTLTLAVSGQGQLPVSITVTPSAIDFGNVAVGSSATASVAVSNNGGVQASVTGSATGPFSLSATTFNLAPNANQTVTITFAPAGLGPAQGSATFAAGNVTQTVTLKGTGVAPSFAFLFGQSNPSATAVQAGGTVPLPPVAVGSNSTTQFFIKNTGANPAAINSISVSAGSFALLGLPAMPANVLSGDSLAFTIRFTPAAPGGASASLTVNGQTFNLTGTGLVSGVTITSGVFSAAQQPNITISLAQSYAAPISGQLVISFSPNAAGAPDDPMIQFATGGTCSNFNGPAGRCVAFTIPAGATAAQFPGNVAQIGLQTGTVAGSINLTATFSAGGTDVTPSPAPVGALTIARSAPVIQSVTATRSGSTLQLVIIAFATSREVNTVRVQFNPAAGANLQTTALSVDVGSIFTNWFASSAAASFGSLFKLTLPFTVQGDPGAVTGASVTLLNGDGQSAASQTNF
jgi:hypothetical protein